MPTATNDRRAYIRRRPVEVAVNDGASRVLGLGFLFVAAMGPNLDCDEIFKADSTGEVRPWMCQGFGHRSSRGRWYFAVRSETYLGLLVPGSVMTLVGALSSPAAMAARMRAQNASSMAK